MRERRWSAIEDDEQRWLMKALREVANELVEEIYELASADPTIRAEDDDRTPHEIAAHIRLNEELAAAQIRHLTGGRSNVRLPVDDTESPPAELADTSIYNFLEGFIEARRGTTRLLWNLSPAQWQRQGTHPYRGAITVQQIVRELAEHDLEHLWQVRRTKSNLRDDTIP
jgi:hypothetical protein